jgi:cytochrome c oxidase subunit 4
MSQHVLSLRTYYTIFAILMVLLFLTIAVAYVDLGVLGVPVAMTIATVKAILILLYFMHVKFSDKLVWIFSTAAFFWLVFLLLLVLGDYASRDWLAILGK